MNRTPLLNDRVIGTAFAPDQSIDPDLGRLCPR